VKIDVSVEFFEYWESKPLKDFQSCLKDIEEERLKFGKIELLVADGKIVKVCEVRHFEK
jgi:hypothetical protein